MIIDFKVENQRLTSDTNLSLIERSKNYIKCRFTFNDEWAGLYRLALFLPTGDTIPYPAEIDDNGECMIPPNVAYNGGQCRLAVVGCNTEIDSGTEINVDDVVITTNACRLHFDTTIRCDDLADVEDVENPFFVTLRQNTLAIESLKNDFSTAAEHLEQHDTDIHNINHTLDTELPEKADKEYVNERVNEETAIIKSDIEGIQKQMTEEAHFRGYLSTNAKIQSLEATPNDFAYSAESGTKWVYVEQNGWQDTGTPVPDQLTPASDTMPLMNGEASVGQESSYARGDHRHPTDTTRVGVTEFNEFKTENSKAMTDGLAKKQDIELVWQIVDELTLTEDVDGYTFNLRNSDKTRNRTFGAKMIIEVPKEKAAESCTLIASNNDYGWIQNFQTTARAANTAQSKIINVSWEPEHGYFNAIAYARTGGSLRAGERLYCHDNHLIPAMYLDSVRCTGKMYAGTKIKVWGLVK